MAIPISRILFDCYKCHELDVSIIISYRYAMLNIVTDYIFMTDHDRYFKFVAFKEIVFI